MVCPMPPHFVSMLLIWSQVFTISCGVVYMTTQSFHCTVDFNLLLVRKSYFIVRHISCSVMRVSYLTFLFPIHSFVSFCTSLQKCFAVKNWGSREACSQENIVSYLIFSLTNFQFEIKNKRQMCQFKKREEILGIHVSHLEGACGIVNGEETQDEKLHCVLSTVTIPQMIV